MPADPNYGPVITQAIDFNLFNDFAADHAFILEDASYPVFGAWFAEGAKPGFLHLDSVWRFLRHLIARLRGDTMGSIGYAFHDLLKGDISYHTCVLLYMGVDKSNGTMTLRDGWLDLDWPQQDSQPLYRAIFTSASVSAARPMAPSSSPRRTGGGRFERMSASMRSAAASSVTIRPRASPARRRRRSARCTATAISTSPTAPSCRMPSAPIRARPLPLCRRWWRTASPASNLPPAFKPPRGARGRRRHRAPISAPGGDCDEAIIDHGGRRIEGRLSGRRPAGLARRSRPEIRSRRRRVRRHLQSGAVLRGPDRHPDRRQLAGFSGAEIAVAELAAISEAVLGRVC